MNESTHFMGDVIGMNLNAKLLTYFMCFDTRLNMSLKCLHSKCDRFCALTSFVTNLPTLQ